MLNIIDKINSNFKIFNFIGYFDDGFDKGTVINNFTVLGGIDELNAYKDKLSVIVAIGSPIVKKKIIDNISNENISFPTIIDPSVILGNTDYISIGDGCIICAGTIITTNINIGAFTILNLCCTVGHDTNIGQYSSFMPSVNISGEVLIGESVYVGTGAKIINQLSIGNGAIIGAGAVVSKSIPANCTAVGVPAKPIKFHNE